MIEQRRNIIAQSTKKDISDLMELILTELVEKEKSSQGIFGGNNDNLQYFVSRGWKVERFVDGLSLKQQNYSTGGMEREEGTGESITLHT